MDVTNVGRVLRLVQLNVLEVVFVLKVLVQSVLHFHSAEKVLDPVPLLIKFKLAQLVTMLAFEALGKEQL